jgi:quinone-modifying oxidoreductase, subunit QmoC
MSHRADPGFMSELEKYGTVNVESCFNCGNCTAVCPLSTAVDSFPRRMIRYAQLGMREKLLGSKELWLCYYCGECTATCPRQANPGEFMAAARRYAIAQYDRLGLARWLYTSTVFTVLFLTALGAVLGVFLYAFHGPMPGDTLRLFDFIPSEVVHNLGVIAIILIAAVALAGIATMVIQVGKPGPFGRSARPNWFGALWETIGEVIGQLRYRKECEAYSPEQPWYIQKWFIHASMLWGFMGLFLATALDYLLELLGIKATGMWVPIWYPIRLLGTVAGLLLMYGTTFAILKRLRREDEAATFSTTSDWAFLALLWLAGFTGFILEVAIYLPRPYAWDYWMLLAHLIVVAELLLLWPFTKFAHAIYRTVALYVCALKPTAEAETAGAGAGE